MNHPNCARVFLALCIVGAEGIGGSLAAQASTGLREIPLGEIPLHVTGDGVELNRVLGASSSPAGVVAVVDAGNSRIVVVDPQGPVRVLGRRGEGPGEFVGLHRIDAGMARLVAYDFILQRIESWTLSGSRIGGFSVPQIRGRHAEIVDLLSTSEWVGLVTARSGGSRAGLALDSADVFYGRGDSTVVARMRLPWRYEYLFVQAQGSTTYSVPFTGETRVLLHKDGLLVARIDRATLEMHYFDSRPSVSIALPVGMASLGRTEVAQHRDSLLALLGSSAGRYPGARERIEAAFAPSLRVPSARSPVVDIKRAGDRYWIRLLQPRTENRQIWYLFDPSLARLVGFVRMPERVTLLSGGESTIVGLFADRDGVEKVAVYSLGR